MILFNEVEEYTSEASQFISRDLIYQDLSDFSKRFVVWKTLAAGNPIRPLQTFTTTGRPYQKFNRRDFVSPWKIE